MPYVMRMHKLSSHKIQLLPVFFSCSRPRVANTIISLQFYKLVLDARLTQVKSMPRINKKNNKKKSRAIINSDAETYKY